MISEVEWDPKGVRPFVARLALGFMGPRGTTLAEAMGMVGRAESVAGADPYTTVAIDPADMVESLADRRLAPVPGRPTYCVHLAQGSWGLGDETDLIDVVSRFNPTFDPWSGWSIRSPVSTAPSGSGRPFWPRILACGSDRDEDALGRVGRLRERCVARPEVLFDADRAEATLLDLRASLSSPTLIAEIAICSDDPLPDSLLRSISASFTSQTDVLRQQGHT